MSQQTKKRTLGAVLFPGFELLDLCGPLEMFGNLRERLKVLVIAENPGEVASTQGPALKADHGFADCPPLDFLLVPGGWGTRDAIGNPVFMRWLQERGEAAELVMSVCTGSALLAKAGLLEGRRATSNKKSFDWVCEQGPRVDWVREARWVDDGDRVTSSGVSAGIDMALAVVERFYGAEVAEKLATYAEYHRETDSTRDPFAAIWK